MNNLRQQAAMVAQQQQQQQQQGQLQGNLTSAMGDSSLKNNSPVGARSNQQLTPQQNAAPAPLPHPSQQGQAQAQHNFQSQQQQQQQMTKMAGSQGMKRMVRCQTALVITVVAETIMLYEIIKIN